MAQAVICLRRVFSGIFSALGGVLVNVGLILFDIVLALYNLVTPNRRKGNVVPKGCP